jgi:photosystem II stability/assembly factor-like uncharacterized protein
MIDACIPGRWILAVLVMLLCFASPSGIAAQEQDVPEHAVHAPLAARSLLLDAAAVDGMLVVVGERGHILRSTDQGSTWEQAEVPTRANLTGVYFHDASVGWAVGHDGVILKTVDGGLTWERQRWAPEEENPLLEVWFSSADKGFAIGAYGTFLVTDDGGATWTFEPIGDADWHLHQLRPSTGGRLYMAAEAGFAYRSDDGGVTWTELPSPYEGSFFGVLPLEDDAVLLFGLRGHLFRSSDAGETWTEVETPTVAMLTDGTVLDDGRILITGLGGTVLVSADGGHSFSIVEQPSRRGIQAVVQASPDSLLLVGEFGTRLQAVSGLAGAREGVAP